jgi:hypothetical protein
MNGEMKTQAELAVLRSRLMAMSLDEAEKFYHTAYRCCQLISKVPEPIMIQHLVTAWRVLRIRGGERRKTDTPLKEGGPEGCLPARPREP